MKKKEKSENNNCLRWRVRKRDAKSVHVENLSMWCVVWCVVCCIWWCVNVRICGVWWCVVCACGGVWCGGVLVCWCGGVLVWW